MNRRFFMGLFGFLPFVRRPQKNEQPVIRPEGITLTTALCVWNKPYEHDQVPHITISSTDAEDIRRRLIQSFDKTMLAWLSGDASRMGQAREYLANRQDPYLDEFFELIMMPNSTGVKSAYMEPNARVPNQNHE